MHINLFSSAFYLEDITTQSKRVSYAADLPACPNCNISWAFIFV